MSKSTLTQSEILALQEVLKADYKNGNIRLREGEYQYSLAKAIASFELNLHFPDVKDLIKMSFGEGKADDIQFVRKIQTILKKMERSSIVKILPKAKPWELQRYTLSSFKFHDVDKNDAVFATEEQIKHAQESLHSLLNQMGSSTGKLRKIRLQNYTLMFLVVISYVASLWSLVQPIINPIIFISAFSVAVVCSLMLGKTLTKE